MADYFLQSQIELDAEKEPNSGLCCCEYIDRHNKRYHIVSCCCDCEDFDKVFTNCLTCRPIDRARQRNMLLTFQDRLRIPWHGGAKQVTLDSIAPIFVIPLLISLAAINAYTCMVIFLATSVIICYAFNYVQRRAVRTSFFSMWIISSLLYLIFLFETTGPLLEVLPEENLALVVLSLVTLVSFWKARKRATLNNVIAVGSELPGITETSANEEDDAEQTTLLIEQDLEDIQTTIDDASGSQPNRCATCRKGVPARTAHCPLCRVCIRRYDHHSYWLNCCIGEKNHRLYIVGLIFAIFALLLGADLILTAVCHPFKAANIFGLQILLPDDCTGVFDMYEFGLAFVLAVYALLITACMVAVLVRQLYLISRGITMHEYKRGMRGNNKTVKYNWKNFIL